MEISGKKLKAAREAAGVSVSRISVDSGLTSRRIWQIETDDVAHVNEHIVAVIAKSVGLKDARELAP